MSLPGEVRDKVFGMVLPIDFDFRRRKMRGQDVQPTNVLVISEAFGVGTSRTRPPAKIKFHPLIRVCRQLRYEYGALISKFSAVAKSSNPALPGVCTLIQH